VQRITEYHKYAGIRPACFTEYDAFCPHKDKLATPFLNSSLKLITAQNSALSTISARRRFHPRSTKWSFSENPGSVFSSIPIVTCTVKDSNAVVV